MGFMAAELMVYFNDHSDGSEATSEELIAVDNTVVLATSSASLLMSLIQSFSAL